MRRMLLKILQQHRGAYIERVLLQQTAVLDVDALLIRDNREQIVGITIQDLLT